MSNLTDAQKKLGFSALHQGTSIQPKDEINGWVSAGWLGKDAVELLNNGSVTRSDHGERREVVLRADGSGWNIFYQEVAATAAK